jgi:hypothetical protein
MALKGQAEGRSAVTTRKAKAYALVASASYTGKGKFSFDQYVGRHQKAHNALLELDEPVPETKKVRDFMDGIRDPKLENALSHILGDRMKLESFEECQQYLKTVVENAKSRPMTADRHVATVQRGKDRQKAKHKAKRKAGAAVGAEDSAPSGIGIHAGYYAPKDFNKLKPFERAEVLRLRKEKSRNISVVASVEEPQAEEPQAEEPQVQEGEGTPTRSNQSNQSVANAGLQFGRGAHVGQKKKD